MPAPKHLYTLHHTYTGKGCALCGHGPEVHPLDAWMVDGEKKELKDGNNFQHTS